MVAVCSLRFGIPSGIGDLIINHS